MRPIFVMVLARKHCQLTNTRSCRGPRVPPRKPGNGQRRNSIHGERPGPLEPEQSAALREKLLTKLGTITSADLAAIWAQEALTAKNSLTAADAKLVEDAFEHRLSELAPSASAEAADDAAASTDVDLLAPKRPRFPSPKAPNRRRHIRHPGLLSYGRGLKTSTSKIEHIFAATLGNRASNARMIFAARIECSKRNSNSSFVKIRSPSRE